MKKLIAIAGTALIATQLAWAGEFATTKEAEELVARVVKALATNKDATLKEITAKDPKWVKGDLYPWVQVKEAAGNIVLAHGASEKLVGKDVSGLNDIDGKPFNRELQEATVAKGKSWTDYKFSDPATKKVLPKSAYCEKISGETIACAGIYKR